MYSINNQAMFSFSCGLTSVTVLPTWKPGRDLCGSAGVCSTDVRVYEV